MMMVMVRRSILVERGGVVDDGGRVRVPLVMRMSDNTRWTGGSVHAIVATATSSASTTDGVRLQPFGRYVQQRRWLLLLLLRWRRPSGWCDRSGRRWRFDDGRRRGPGDISRRRWRLQRHGWRRWWRRRWAVFVQAAVHHRPPAQPGSGCRGRAPCSGGNIVFTATVQRTDGSVPEVADDDNCCGFGRV